MKKIFIGLFAVTLIFTLGLSAGAYLYEPPYEAVDGGRAAQNMPEIFSVDTAEKILAASADFDGAENFQNLTRATNEASWWSVTEAGVKITKDTAGTDTRKSVVYIYRPQGGIAEGEIYAFVCRIRTEGIQGGAVRNGLEAWSTKWLNQTHGYDGKNNMTGTQNWYTMTQFLQMPAGTTNLHLSFNMGDSVTGTAYFDDLRLYKVMRDPMESVLVAPNYKGLIYGDGKADINANVLVREQNDFYDFEDLGLCARLVDENDTVLYKSEAENLGELTNFVFSSDGLAVGDYYLQTVLTDKSNDKVLAEKEHTIRKRNENYRPDTFVDDNGHLVRNGSKKILKRLSGYNAAYRETAEAAISMNVDSLSHYGMWWATGSYENDMEYMRQNGLTTHICLSSYWFSDLSGNMGTSFIKKQSDILPFFTQVADDYKNDPVLELYYLYDEPDPITKGEEIRWNNEIMAQADINHPTIGTADKGYDEYGIYTKMSDILVVDPYPVTGNETDNFAKTGQVVKKVRKNFPNRPIYLTLQGFHYAARGDMRSPNYKELRNMAWQAIAEGAEGFDCYAYPDMKTDTTKDLETWKSEIKAIYDEVEKYESVILSDEPSPGFTVAGGGEWLNLAVRRYDGKNYIFAVNNTNKPHSATVNVEGKEIKLDFEALDVKIEQMSGESFLSHEAELYAMGFSNGNEVFAVNAGEENILYISDESDIINYCANISDGAKLFIGEIQMPQKGKITVRVAESFDVSVVAEDGVTINTKTYKVVKK